MSSGFSITDQLNPGHAGVMEGYMARADDAKVARANAQLAPQLQFQEGDDVWIINPFPSSQKPESDSKNPVFGPGPYDSNTSYRDNWRPAGISGRPVWIPAVVKEIDVKMEQIVVVPTIGPDVNIVFDSDVLPRDDAAADRADNMIYLRNEHAAAILDNLQARFHDDQPYTFANNAVLVAINTYRPEGIKPGAAAPWAELARQLPRGTPTKVIDLFDPSIQLLYAQEADKPPPAAGKASAAAGGTLSQQQKGDSALPPHIFSVAQQALTTLIKRKMKPQVIVVNGEAGSGKSTNRKLIQDYLVTATCPGRDHAAGPSQLLQGSAVGHYNTAGIPDTAAQLLYANVILDAFGNAYTTRNSSGCGSSMFSEYLKIFFDNGHIAGAEITAFLLDHSRLLSFRAHERTFHVFYMLLAGLDDESRAALRVRDVLDYDLMNPILLPGDDPNDGFLGSTDDDKAGFETLVAAFEAFGISKEAQQQVFRLLVGILELGNITFYESEEKFVVVRNVEVLERAADLLGIAPRELEDSIFMKVTATNEVQFVTYDEAVRTKNNILRAIYSNLFHFLVAKMNVVMGGQPPPPVDLDTSTESQSTEEESLNDGPTIDRTVFYSILDVTGLDQASVVEENSLERLCMNFCAEKVQQLQVRYLFKNEEAICLAEGISAEEFHYQDNADVVQNLFERQHVGFFALLDDASKYPRETDAGFIKRCVANLEGDVFHRVNADVATYETVQQRSVARRATESLFSVTHFTGDTVVYNVNGFLDKNRNYYYGLASDVMEMFGRSSNSIIASAFHTSGHSAAAGSPGRSPSRRAAAMGVRARKSMGTLVKNVRSKLRVVFESLSFGDQYFIQCFRPNLAQLANAFSPHLVNRSLHVYGVLDCVQHRAVGFEWHGKYKNFIMRFLPIVKGNDYLRWPRPPGVTKKALAFELMRELLIMARRDLQDFIDVDVKFGRDMIFLRYNVIDELEALRRIHLKNSHGAARILQRVWRRFLGRKRIQEMQLGFERMQVAWKDNFYLRSWQTKLRSVDVVENCLKNFLVRREYETKKAAAVVLQRFLRIKKQRMQWLRIRRGMRVMHWLARGFVVRQHVFRMLGAVRTIQRAVRAYRLRAQDHWRRVWCCLLVQAKYRGGQWRQNHPEFTGYMIKQQAERRRRRAVRTVEDAWKTYLVRQQLRTLRSAAETIQRWVRNTAFRRHVIACTEAAILGQAIVRGFFARRLVDSIRSANMLRDELYRLREVRNREALILADYARQPVPEYPMRDRIRARDAKYFRVFDVDTLLDNTDCYPSGWTVHARELENTLAEQNAHVATLVCGASHSVALASDGRIYTWGWGDQGQLGRNATDDEAPTQVELFQRCSSSSTSAKAQLLRIPAQRVNVVQVASGEDHSCALTAAGSVFTWGSNSRGQLGHGDLAYPSPLATATSASAASGRARYVATPTLVENLWRKKATQVACGAFHTVILSEAGSLFTFGAGAQLGIGAIAKGRGDRSLPCCLQELSRRARFRAIACGLNFTLALTHRGNLFSWGDNESGQLGVGDRRHRFVPTLVPALGFRTQTGAEGSTGSTTKAVRRKTVAAIACGNRHCVALSVGGHVYTWGSGRDGQLGLGTGAGNLLREEPTLVRHASVSSLHIADVACGQRSTFALSTHHRLFAWGQVKCVASDAALEGKGLDTLLNDDDDDDSSVFRVYAPAVVPFPPGYAPQRVHTSFSHTLSIAAVEFTVLPKLLADAAASAAASLVDPSKAAIEGVPSTPAKSSSTPNASPRTARAVSDEARALLARGQGFVYVLKGEVKRKERARIAALDQLFARFDGCIEVVEATPGAGWVSIAVSDPVAFRRIAGGGPNACLRRELQALGLQCLRPADDVSSIRNPTIAHTVPINDLGEMGAEQLRQLVLQIQASSTDVQVDVGMAGVEVQFGERWYPCNVLAKAGEDLFDVEVLGKFGPIHRLTGFSVSPNHKQAIDTDTRHVVPRGKLRLQNSNLTAAADETKRVDARQIQASAPRPAMTPSRVPHGETKTPAANAVDSPFRHESSLRSELLELHRNRVVVPPPMGHVGESGLYYDKNNRELARQVRNREKQSSAAALGQSVRDANRVAAAASVDASAAKGDVEVTGLFSTDKLLESRRAQNSRRLGRTDASQAPAGIGESVGSRFNFVNLAQQYSRSQGRDTMKEQLRQARGVTVPELFEQASRDQSPPASTQNSFSQDRNYQDASYGGGGDDYSLGSFGRAPAIGLRDADASVQSNEAFAELDDDVAQLKAELARLRQQKEKILRSPLETITATSFASPTRAAAYRGGGGAATSDDVNQQIRSGMSKIRAEAQKALNEMWGSPFKSKRPPSADSSTEEAAPRLPRPDTFGSDGEEPRDTRPKPISASEISIQSAEELYNYVQQAQRDSGL